jgi:hypothetical protein
VVDAYYIARASYRKTVQNLALAFAFNGVGVPLATTGLVHPVWAMVAMVLSVSTVLVNSFGGRLIPKGREAKRVTPESHRLELHVPSMHCEESPFLLVDTLSVSLGGTVDHQPNL